MNLKQIVQRRSPDQRGFTLLELIIVILIVGILIAIAIPVYGTIQNNARKTAVNDVATRGYESVIASFYDGSADTSPASTATDLTNDDINVTIAPGTLYPASDFCVTATWTGTGAGVSGARGDC